jgi:AraC family transcriptional regulator, positive regulator of tynA and feaB
MASIDVDKGSADARTFRLVSANTAHLPERDKFHYWNEVICRTVVDLDCRPVEQAHFEASIGGFDAPGLGVYDIHTRAHLVYRDKAEISRLDNDALIVNYVTAGALHAEQDGRAVDLLPGDGAVSDAARPYFLGFDRPLGCVSVKVYKSDLRQRVAGIERITAQSMARGSTLNPLVFDNLRALIRHAPTLSASAALKAADMFKDLLAASLNEMLDGAPAPLSAHRGAALLRVKAFVEDHLREPELDAQAVARAVGLSTRYINRLFEAEGTSLARHIWQRRLECCALRLRDLAWAHVATSAVALEHGFSDLSHFSRAFRLRYGMSPRDWRAAGAVSVHGRQQ